MNQTFKKKVMALSVAGAFAFVSGVAFANQFEASTTATPTPVVLVKGSLPKMTASVGFVEVGTFQNAATNPVGVRVTIPAGLDLYGAYLGVALDSTATAGVVATKFAPTSGYTYPLRKTRAPGGFESFIYIDTDDGSSSTPTLSGTGTAWSANKKLAIFAGDGSAAGVGVNLAGSQLLTNVTSSLSTFFAGGVATANTGTTIVANAFNTQVYLRTYTGALTTDTNDCVGTIKAESDGSLTMTLFAAADNAISSDGTVGLVIPPLALAASSTAATGNLSLTVTDGLNATPASSELLNITGVSKTIVTVTENSLALAKNVSTSTIPDGILTLSNQAVDAARISFAAPQTSNANTVTLTLSGGAKWVPTLAEGAGITDTAGSIMDAGATVLNADRTVATITFNSTDIAADTYLVVSGNLLDLTSATAGDINMTVTSSISSAGSQSIKLANAVARGAAVTYSDVSPTGYAKLFAGRTAQATTDSLVLTESATGSLLSNGAIVLTLDKGAKFTASDAVTFTDAAVTSGLSSTLAIADVAVASTATASISTSVGTISSDNKGKSTVSSFDFDLSSATTGDLSVAVSGGAGASGTVKIAEIVNATAASASGTLPVLTPAGSSQTLPDIVITESAYDALKGTTSTFGIKLPTGVTFDNSAAPTITVTTASGTALTGKVGTASVNNFVANIAAVAKSTYNVSVIAPSNSSDGPMTIKVSGLKAQAASTATTGNFSVLIHGNAGAVTAAATGTEETTTASNVGAMPTKQEIVVGSVVSSSVQQIPAATVTGVNTAQTISTSIVPAGNDQGKQGSTFLILHAPNGKFGLTADYYFTMSSTGAFNLMTSCSDAVAYSSGALAQTSMPVVSTAADLSSLVGLKIIVGYGVGGGLTSGSSTACTNMMSNGTWGVSYTIQ